LISFICSSFILGPLLLNFFVLFCYFIVFFLFDIFCMSVSLCDTLHSIKISLQVKAKQTGNHFRVSGLLCLPKAALKAQNIFSFFRFVIWKKHVESSLIVHTKHQPVPYVQDWKREEISKKNILKIWPWQVSTVKNNSQHIWQSFSHQSVENMCTSFWPEKLTKLMRHIVRLFYKTVT